MPQGSSLWRCILKPLRVSPKWGRVSGEPLCKIRITMTETNKGQNDKRSTAQSGAIC